jgi:hypothetical protein
MCGIDGRPYVVDTGGSSDRTRGVREEGNSLASQGGYRGGRRALVHVRFSPFWWLPSLMATLRLSHLPTGTAAHDPFFIYDTVRFDAKLYLPFCTLAYIYTFERCVSCIK